MLASIVPISAEAVIQPPFSLRLYCAAEQTLNTDYISRGYSI